ncbi:MAG: serine--tRNA ligase [Planctomycetota bacterium]
MLDIKVIRDDPEAARQGAIKKRFADRAAAVDRLLEADEKLRALIPEIDGMRTAQKAAAKRMGKLSADERQAHLEEQKKAKQELHQLEEREKELRAAVRENQMLVPMIPDPEVPDGDDDTGNVELRTVGEVPTFDFELRPHQDLAEAQGWLDVQRAGHLAGSRNYYLFGDLALLQDAALRFAADRLIAKGYVAVDPPLLVRDIAMRGTAFFPGGEEQTYSCGHDDLYLIGTSEVPVTALHGDSILDEAELPKLYVARSTCFRREAGTYGKDTKGLYRVHQFQKVEQVVVDIADEGRSKEHHQAILQNSEEILQALQIPYRVVNVCSGDLGVGQVQKFDIESWMPSRESYGETHSASRFYDYQARRLALRYRRAEDRKTAFCHTLNNTALASPRVLIPLLEIHQLPDGRVAVPEVLRPYLGGRETIGRPLNG